MSSNSNRNKPNKNLNNKKKKRQTQLSTPITHKDVSGGKFSPSLNPPDVTAQPWYPLTLSWTSKPSEVTFSTIIEKFRSQLDPTTHGLNQEGFDSNAGNPFRVQFRFRKISVWNLTGRAISLTVWDDLEANNTTKDQLGGWTDCGGPNCFPSIGYVYPISHSHRVHRPDPALKNTIVFNTTASGGTDTVLAHVALLWRFDGSVKVLNVLPSPEERLLASVVSVASAIKAQQPSTVERVIDGASRVAGVVAVAAGAYAHEYAPFDSQEAEEAFVKKAASLVVSQLEQDASDMSII